MKFEEILPEIRKGRKFRQKSWELGHYFFLERDVPDWGDCLTDHNGCSENFSFDISWIIDNVDDWELVPEPVQVADYFILAPPEAFSSGKYHPVWKWRSSQSAKVCDIYYRDTYPIGKQPDGAVLVPGSERNQE